MTYYYNKNGEFQPESSVEYKTQKGAVDRMNKEGEGAVYDETGQLLISLVDEKDVPEGALDTDTDGNVPAYNEKNEQIGTVDAETAALAAGESLEEPGEDPEKQDEPKQSNEDPEEPVEAEQSNEDPEEPVEAEQSNEDPEKQDEPKQSNEDPEEPVEAEQSNEDPEEPVEAEQSNEDPEDQILKQEADLKSTFRQHPNTGILFTVHTTCDSLRIRSGAGHIYRIVGYINEKPDNKKDYDIVEEKNGFGRLADGSGWIDLEHTVEVN